MGGPWTITSPRPGPGGRGVAVVAGAAVAAGDAGNAWWGRRIREVDDPAATGVPDRARQVARTPEMPDDAAPSIVNLCPRTIVGCLGRPVADEPEGCADRQARLAVDVHAPCRVPEVGLAL